MLHQIQGVIQEDLQDIDRLLLRATSRDMQLIDKMRGHTPLVKGKKIRSTLLILLAGACEANHEGLKEIAASIEMLHLSSLIHDDIVDNSEYRRGERTVKSRMGAHLSVLWGDFLFLNSLNLLSRFQKEILHSILSAACEMIEGQIMEEGNNRNYALTLEKYLTIINKKTSSLFVGVTRIPALVAGLDVAKFERFGQNFGIIFQMSDDILDLFSDQSGKDSFRDLDQKKITLPMILLRDEAGIDISGYYAGGHREQLRDDLAKYRIKESCVDRIDHYFQHCQRFIGELNDTPYRSLLDKLLHFIRYRDY